MAVRRGEQLAAQADLALAHQRRRQIRERGEIAAGSHRALFRDPGQQTQIQEVAEALEQQRPHARVAARERGQARGDHRGGLVLAEDPAGAAAVEAHDVAREQVLQPIGNAVVDARAHAGGDAVDRPALGQRPLDRRRAAFQPRAVARVGIQGHPDPSLGHADHVFDAERRASDAQRALVPSVDRHRAHLIAASSFSASVLGGLLAEAPDALRRPPTPFCVLRREQLRPERSKGPPWK